MYDFNSKKKLSSEHLRLKSSHYIKLLIFSLYKIKEIRILKYFSPLQKFKTICSEVKYSLFLSRECHYYYLGRKFGIGLVVLK